MLAKSDQRPTSGAANKRTSSSTTANQRGMARLNAVQALYQMDIANTSLAEIKKQFSDRLAGGEMEGDLYLKADQDYFDQILSGVLANQLVIDPLITQALSEKWPIDRIDATLRAVLRCGAFELKFRTDIPAAIVVSEYIDVAKAFFGGEVPGMVNAVLDVIAKQGHRKQDKK